MTKNLVLCLILTAVLLNDPHAFSAETENSSTASISLDSGGSSTAHLDESFVVTPPERIPASNARKATRPAKTFAGKTTQRRSTLPDDIVNGLEFRVRFKQQNEVMNEMFWVVERNHRYDLIYANSAHSKSTHSLSSMQFRDYYQVARNFKAYEGSLTKCKDASMQLHVLAVNKPERSVTMCLNSKGKVADNLRLLGTLLGNKVR
jgi:hypothetical protein